jgi:hypothetical protein
MKSWNIVVVKATVEGEDVPDTRVADATEALMAQLQKAAAASQACTPEVTITFETVVRSEADVRASLGLPPRTKEKIA